MKLLNNKKTEATDVVVHEVEQEIVNTDARKHARLGWIIILLGVGGFMLWAAFAPLDKGVPVNGSVAVATNRKAVQNLGGGTVDDILVKDGDVVKAGQVLVKMNDVALKAQAEITRGQYFNYLATRDRLRAERDGKTEITFSPELDKAKVDPRIASTISAQAELFSSRRGAIQSELAAADESIAGLREQQHGLEESRENIKQQSVMLKEQLEGMRDLAKDGYVARNRLLDLERTYAQVNGTMAENIGSVGRVQRQVAETTLRKIQRQQEYQKEVRSQLSDMDRDVDALGRKLKEQEFELANVLVRSPVDGTVVAVSIFTKGGVVQAGAHLMDVVPSEDPLIVEGMIPVNMIDKVHVGLKADMTFSAFNRNQTPHVEGVITQVSADRMVDEKSGMSFYKFRAETTDKGKKALANLDVRPGMPVEVFVNTGERTMMSYLLKPVFDRAKTSMTEE
jgi:protease secretion system membrane fusion protein